MTEQQREVLNKYEEVLRSTLIKYFTEKKLLEGQLHGVAVVEIRILLTGIQVQLFRLCLIQRRHAEIAVAVVGGGVGDGQAFLEDLQIQAAVGVRIAVAIPDPDQIPIAGGIDVPLFVVGLDDDGSSSIRWL